MTRIKFARRGRSGRACSPELDSALHLQDRGLKPRRELALALSEERKPSLCLLEFTKFVRDERLRGDEIPSSLPKARIRR